MRKMKIRKCMFISLLLCVFILGCTMTVHAAEEVAGGDGGDDGENMFWTLDSDGVLTISGSGDMPDGYHVNTSNYVVDSSFQAWFQYSDQIYKVIIEEGITSISSLAFYDCVNMTEIEIADTVTSIGDRAFYNCTSLTEVTLTSVTDIGIRAFDGCSSLAEVTFSDNLPALGMNAFCSCVSLEKIEIPGSVKEIGEYTFAYCSSLAEVILQEGVESIGSCAFIQCTALESATIPDSVTEIGTYAFYGCTEICVVCSVNSAAEAYAIENGYKLADSENLYFNSEQEKTAYEKIIALKEDYPEGMSWTDDDYYEWKGGIYTGGYGCAGFAFLLSDAAFGSAPAAMITDFTYEQIRVGDIVRLNNEPYAQHSVVILQVRENYVIVAEGNYNSSIHWGRILSKEKIMNSYYIMTRYTESLCGDVNQDGEVDVTDALTILRAYVGLALLDEEQLDLADADGNGEVEVNDALCVLRYYVGLVEKLPS